MLLASLLYCKFTSLSYVLAAVSLLSKELGVMVFGLFLALDVVEFVKLKNYSSVKRLSKSLVVFLLLVAVRHWYTDGTYLKMSPQDNPISFEPDPWARFLSYFYVHGEYFRLLVWPVWLCYDYSQDTLPVLCVGSDVRLLLPLAGYSMLLSAASLAVRQWSRPLLLSGALFVAVMLPMSNIFFPVSLKTSLETSKTSLHST